MTWDKRFLELAAHIATWSKDPSTQVGAVVVGAGNIVKGIGFNGFPRGVKDTDERLTDKELKYPLIVHAEVNALLNSHTDIRGCTLYVHPLPPCPDCTKMIIQAGIIRVVYPTRTLGIETKWHEEFTEVSYPMLREAGVQV